MKKENYRINFSVLNKVRHTTLIDDKLKGNRFTVFEEIYFEFGKNKTKGAKLAASVIAENTGISLSTVKRSLIDLEAIGAISNKMKGKRTGKGGELETSVWIVNEKFILDTFKCHSDTRIKCHSDTDIKNYYKKDNLCQDDTGKEEKNFVTSNTLKESSPSSSLCEDSGIGFKRINYITSNGLPF